MKIKNLILINVTILFMSVFLVVLLKKHYENYINSESKPRQLPPRTPCSRRLVISKTYPESLSSVQDIFRNAECNPACCMHSPYSCDKGCVCLTPEIRQSLGNTYTKL